MQINAPYVAEAGQAIDLSWVVQNIGASPANLIVHGVVEGSHPWFDSTYISADEAGSISYGSLASASIHGPLNVGESYMATGYSGSSVTLPIIPPGNYYLISRVDTANYLLESDKANNTLARPITITSSASCSGGGKPSLTLAKTGVYWASYADYTSRLLSVDYRLTNPMAYPFMTAYNVMVADSSATNGVILETSMPRSFNVIGVWGSVEYTLRYNVPSGVGSFRTTNTVSASDQCGNGYTYP